MAALTAAMDIIVTTHNVLVMIASGVGAATKFASWKQSPWSNVFLSPQGSSVDLFQRDTWEPWDNVFSLIAEDIVKGRNEGKY